MSDSQEAADNVPDEWAISRAEKRYDDAVAALVGDLHYLGQRIIRASKPPSNGIAGDGAPDYLYAAEQIVHELTWGVANMNIGSRLLSAAAEAHATARGRFK